MAGFQNVVKMIIPYGRVAEAYRHMRTAGKQKLEGAALFVGNINDDIFKVEATIIPAQKAYSLEDGLLYAIDGDELHRINVMLYEKEWSLFAQIHSHPGRAYHSTTDDAYPVVSTVGGISIVIPNFATGPVDLSTWAVYRLSSDNTWNELSKIDKETLISIE